MEVTSTSNNPKEADLLGLISVKDEKSDVVVELDDDLDDEDLLLGEEEKPASSVLALQESDDKSGSKKSKLEVKRLLSLAKPEVWYIVMGTICLVIANLALLTIPYFVGKIIDVATGKVHSDNPKGVLISSVIELSVFIMISALFATIRVYLFTIAGERVVTRLRKQLYSAIVVQEIAFFDETKTGELINRLSSDCTVLQNTITVNVSMSLRSIFSFFAGLFALFYISWKLCLVILASMPFIAVSAIFYGRFVKKLSKDFQDALASAADSATEAITLIRTVRSFSKEEFEMDQYGKKVDHSFDLARKRSIANSLFAGGVTFFANISMSGIVYYGGYLVLHNELTAGNLTSFAIYAISVASAVGVVTSLYGDFMKAIGSSERVFELLDREPKVNWKGGLYPKSTTGHLEMKDVHFSYPSRPDVAVLEGINLVLSPGKIVALVGPSGSGKSTIVALLEAFYYPTKGKVYLDDVDIKELDPRFLRKQIGIVSQEPMLFGTTIAQNISYGDPNVSKDRIIEAAKLANAHQFISRFPDGYDTIVGERGVRLSGGQKQRVAIARALITDPSILLLDEATSALDAESEHLVQQALDTLMKGRTVLVIAHRLSTVKNADQVCVVHRGKITEQGTHDELISKPKGMYAKLVRRQLQK